MSHFMNTLSPIRSNSHLANTSLMQSATPCLDETSENNFAQNLTHQSHVFDSLQKNLLFQTPSIEVDLVTPIMPRARSLANQLNSLSPTPLQQASSSSSMQHQVLFESAEKSSPGLLEILDGTSERILTDLTNSPEFLEADKEDADEEEEETEEQRRAREDEESAKLAWEIMQQEQEELFQMQLQFMQQAAGGMSEEDYAALQAVMQENQQQQQILHAVNQEEGEEGEEGDNNEEGEEEEEEEEWDYEQLLELGQRLGDVKTERWRLRAKNVIASLPTRTYEEVLANHPEGKEKDYRCVVCMESFENAEVLCLLPCCHYFHDACTSGWLADHNSCPSCKQKVTASP